MQKRNVAGIDHFLYDNEEEFRKYYTNEKLIDNWRDGVEDSWVKTDDGKVCQVLGRGTMTDSGGKRIREYVRTVMGTFCCESMRMEGEMRKNIYSMSSVDVQGVWNGEFEKTRSTSKEFLFGQYIIMGESVADAYIHAFKTKNRKYAKTRGNLLLCTNRVQNMIKEEINKYLEATGITPQYLLDQMKAIVDKEDTKDGDKIRAIQTLMQISGLMDTERKTQSVALFKGFTDEQIRAIQGGQARKLIEAKEEVK